MVAFGVPDQKVDALIEAFAGSRAAPGRWVVFGTDVNLLAALERQWHNAVSLVLVLMPRSDGDMVDVALDVLTREQLEPTKVVWWHGAELAADPPSGFRAALRLPRGTVELVPELVLEMLD
jgi:hypothetical protein